MTLTGQQIVVIGAGIGGLAAALSLRRRGAQVTVLEQAAEITEAGAGLQISPNGFAVLRALGLGDTLRARSVQARAVSLRDFRRGNEVLQLDLRRLPADQTYHFVHRADLIALLEQAVHDAGIRVALSHQVMSVVPGHRSALVLNNGQQIKADLIIGADGLGSVLRPVLNGASTPFFTGQVAWRAVVPNVTGHPAHARVHMGPGCHLVSYPLRGGRCVNLVAVQERTDWAAEGWNHSDDPTNLKTAFALFSPEVHQLLNAVTDVRLWGLFRHPVASHWIGSGVALLGDAAHPTLPFLAQGANMALEDAWVLADALSGTGSQSDRLAQYQNRRHARVSRVIAAANGNAWKYHLKPGPVRAVAHLGMRVLGRMAPGRMVHQFDWLYGLDVTKK